MRSQCSSIDCSRAAIPSRPRRASRSPPECIPRADDAGRSNVGKSSLLNALTGIKGLARTSKTPGRTQSINLFAIGESLALADLPGYGYAKMPQAVAQRIASSMSEYLHHRENLAGLVMLVDSRRGPGREELDLADVIRARELSLIVAA